MSINDLSDTIEAKSDQLNADDLAGSTKTIVVTGVVRYAGKEAQCFYLDYQGGTGRPFKPCKSVRRVIMCGWGKDGSQWIGRSMTLYCDSSVIYAGKEVGGIRVSHMSDIPKRITIKLTEKRGSKKEVFVEILEPTDKPMLPDATFETYLASAKQKILALEKTNEQIITQIEVKVTLTDEQKAKIREIGNDELTMREDEFESDE
tara:strand:- start:80 stop:691 length:612 start_codon:yes stop_codon:yes gene_type:complete